MPGGPEVVAAIDALIRRIESATRNAVIEGTALVERLAKADAPVKTGTLRRSIVPTPPAHVGPGIYAAKVGPTVVYGRQRELGGHIYPVRAKVLSWVGDDGVRVYRHHVYQHPRPYLKPAAEVVRTRFRAIAEKHWARAIEG